MKEDLEKTFDALKKVGLFSEYLTYNHYLEAQGEKPEKKPWKPKDPKEQKDFDKVFNS